MNKKLKIVILLHTFFLLGINCFSQSLASNALDVSIKDISIKGRDLGATLEAISIKYNVPIGFECSDSELTQNTKINLVVKNTSLRNVLDLLVQQNSNYIWDVNDEVINFVPLKAKSAFVKKLLQTKIALFNPRKNSNKEEVKAYLAQLPEVKELFKKVNPFTFSVVESNSSKKKLSDDALNSRTNINFRSILNEIVKNSDDKFWTIRGINVDKDDDLVIIIF